MSQLRLSRWLLRLVPAFLTAALPALAYAEHFSWHPLVPCGTTGTPDCDTCLLLKLVENLISFTLFELIMPFTVIAVLVGGFLLLFSGGSEKMVSTGKQIVLYAILGFVVAFVSWVVVDEIISFFAGETFPLPWNEISCDKPLIEEGS